MLGALQAKVSSGAADLRREFGAAEPFRNVVIDEFLGALLCERLIAEFAARLIDGNIELAEGLMRTSAAKTLIGMWTLIIIPRACCTAA